MREQASGGALAQQAVRHLEGAFQVGGLVGRHRQAHQPLDGQGVPVGVHAGIDVRLGLAPAGVPRADGIVLLVGVLAAPVRLGVGQPEPFVQIGLGGLSRLQELGPVEEQGRLGVDADEGGIVLQHLLVVGDAPVAPGGVAEEAALDGVPQVTAAHLLQSAGEHQSRGLLSGARLRLQQQRGQCVGAGELHPFPEAAELLVEALVEGGEGPGHHRLGDVGGGGLRLGFLLSLPGLVGFQANVVPALVPDLQDLAQQGVELVRGHVGGPGHDLPVGGEHRHTGPAAHIVAAVDVGTQVVVHPDGHERLVERLDHVVVGERGLVHDVAPVAPDGGDGEEDGPVLAPGLDEGLLAPEVPLDLVGLVRSGREPERLHRAPSLFDASGRVGTPARPAGHSGESMPRVGLGKPWVTCGSRSTCGRRWVLPDPGTCCRSPGCRTGARRARRAGRRTVGR